MWQTIISLMFFYHLNSCMEQGWNVFWCNVKFSFCFARKHSQFRRGIKRFSRHHLELFLLNNTNNYFSTEAHVPAPQYGQYPTHAHNHITPAVAAMYSCFVLIGLISMEQRREVSLVIIDSQLSLAASTWVIWLCACIRYWPYHRVSTCAPMLKLVFWSTDTTLIIISLNFQAPTYL